MNDRKTELFQKIIKYNQLYRIGASPVSDEVYDNMIDELSAMGENISDFKRSLTEPAGRVKHPFVMGSLEKISYENPEDLKKWVNELCKERSKFKLSVTPKVDGLSCRLKYCAGKLVCGVTRGNGYYGIDITDKIQHISTIPVNLPEQLNLDIRGELVITHENFAQLNIDTDNLFKNARNAAAGIINRKDEYSLLKYMDFVAYEIMGYTVSQNYAAVYEDLSVLRFNTVPQMYVDIREDNMHEEIKAIYESFKKICPYTIDGVVLTGEQVQSENEYYPKYVRAFKVNSLISTTTILDISFEGPSKDGRFTPVAIIEPIELGGSTISRVTCHNVTNLIDQKICYGSKVVVQKSGDVIPYIKEVIQSDSETLTPIILPKECPYCSTALTMVEPNLMCLNEQCPERKAKQLEQFIKKLEIKNVSLKTLKNLNLNTIEDLLAWKPDNSITHKSFYKELMDKLFTKSYVDILSCLNFENISDTTFRKIISHYGLPAIYKFNKETVDFQSYPSGVAQTTMSNFCNDICDNIRLADLVVQDERWVGGTESIEQSSAKLNKCMCFTGQLVKFSRNEAIKLAEKAGYTVKSSVSKGLDYLVTNELGNSTKSVKAKQLGTTVINEEQFIALITPKDEMKEELAAL